MSANAADSMNLRGLYVLQHAGWTASGYTAEEIGVLLESEEYRSARVYKIVRATPDGQIEMKGVSNQRFALEAGMLFQRYDLSEAQGDFRALTALGGEGAAPCRAFVHLIDRGPVTEIPRYATALIYPAEHDDDVAAWLLAIGYSGGDFVEGGISAVTDFYHESHSVLERVQLWSAASRPVRSRDELLASVRQAAGA